MAELPDNSVSLVITSPPYWNQKEYSHWALYSDYLQDVYSWVSEIGRILKPGRHCFWVIPDKLPWPPKISGLTDREYMPIYADTEEIARESGLIPEFPIIWKKPHGSQLMLGSYPNPPTIIHTPMTERICVWRKPGKPDKYDPDIKESSKISKANWVDYAQDLWEIAPTSIAGHPAPYPVQIPRRILLLWSFIGDMVLDPFMGSGTTAVAAIKMGRSYLGFERSREYCDLAEERIRDLLRQPRLIGT